MYCTATLRKYIIFQLFYNGISNCNFRLLFSESVRQFSVKPDACAKLKSYLKMYIYPVLIKQPLQKVTKANIFYKKNIIVYD